MNGKGRYFLDTNALVALGNGNDALRTMLKEGGRTQVVRYGERLEAQYGLEVA